MKNVNRWVVAALLFLPSLTQAQLRFDVESGLVLGTNYNEVRIPSAGGTLFDLGKELSASPKVYYRLRLGYTIGELHTISALYAPLAVRYSGSFARRETVFNGLAFGTGQPVEARYQFNSYRLTYRYDFIHNPKLRLGGGFTAKIRDADMRVSSDGGSTHYDNVGFVPLLNLVGTWQPTPKFLVLLEADALAAPQGRAEDVFFGLGYQLNPFVAFKAGYRVVEGGANNDKIYNFTWINYVAAGLVVAF